LRIGANAVQLTIAGQTLSGNFFFEQSKTPPAVAGQPEQRIVRLAATNVGIFLGDDKGTGD
jgi:hypothetical protein